MARNFGIPQSAPAAPAAPVPPHGIGWGERLHLHQVNRRRAEFDDRSQIPYVDMPERPSILGIRYDEAALMQPGGIFSHLAAVGLARSVGLALVATNNAGHPQAVALACFVGSTDINRSVAVLLDRLEAVPAVTRIRADLCAGSEDIVLRHDTITTLERRKLPLRIDTRHNAIMVSVDTAEYICPDELLACTKASAATYRPSAARRPVAIVIDTATEPRSALAGINRPLGLPFTR